MISNSYSIVPSESAFAARYANMLLLLETTREVRKEPISERRARFKPRRCRLEGQAGAPRVPLLWQLHAVGVFLIPRMFVSQGFLEPVRLSFSHSCTGDLELMPDEKLLTTVVTPDRAHGLKSHWCRFPGLPLFDCHCIHCLAKVPQSDVFKPGVLFPPPKR